MISHLQCSFVWNIFLEQMNNINRQEKKTIFLTSKETKLRVLWPLVGEVSAKFRG
jgi:hypothetical protein